MKYICSLAVMALVAMTVPSFAEEKAADVKDAKPACCKKAECECKKTTSEEACKACCKKGEFKKGEGKKADKAE